MMTGRERFGAVVTHSIMWQKHLVMYSTCSSSQYFLQQIKSCNDHLARRLRAYLCSTVAWGWRLTRTSSSCAYTVVVLFVCCISFSQCLAFGLCIWIVLYWNNQGGWLWVEVCGIWIKPVFETLILGLTVQWIKSNFPQVISIGCKMIIMVIYSRTSFDTDLRRQHIYVSIKHDLKSSSLKRSKFQFQKIILSYELFKVKGKFHPFCTSKSVNRHQGVLLHMWKSCMKCLQKEMCETVVKIYYAGFS